ncbi:SepM family pheromone-processing serine protease [Desertibacillus haloalkaliphilus]|uniref:SepM family pheromone-processing serine protease n=1 Tax=Desertibacillus haloalkaliphilus TaxID=1328930 RepID=UPI001C2627D5|nr:SepM family pheromone-processing serine protease [Desertibacillus haloalkaliphilus]MBU8907130.1 PDZ domain-containing protein [Desertibacillus haloalkaliphilus]
MVTKKSPKTNNKKWVILIVILLAIHFYQLPYYYTQPGDAKVLASIINIEDGYEEDGSFMLTTVQMGKANLLFYTWAQFSDYRELFKEEEIRRPDESDAEYHHRQLMMMTSSQEAAKIVAYTHAGKQIDYDYRGVLVTSTIEGMPAEEHLQLEDRIIAVDGEHIQTTDELLALLGDKAIGDNVHLTVNRNEEEFDVTLSVAPFPKEYGAEEGAGGIGIAYPVTDRSLLLDPDVSIDTDQIGGPSAGLMFSLQIYNKLIEEDITKGYPIAGTGTINEEGVVGSIGGVKQKVVAADRAGAHVFFAPNEGGRVGSNYEQAVEAADDIGTHMKIVPVDTFEDALSYLQQLELD